MTTLDRNSTTVHGDTPSSLQERMNATTAGSAIAEAGRLQAEAERDRYRAALERIACYNDTGASARLEATGSYSGFDEPGSVEIARAALATPAGEGEGR